MSACEVCWDLAFIRSKVTGRPQAECYLEVLAENEGDPLHLGSELLAKLQEVQS